MTAILGTLILPLADPRPADSQVGPGLIGFLMFLFLAVATVLLWLSLRRHLKKVRFEEAPPLPRRGAGRTASSSPDPAAGGAVGAIEPTRAGGNPSEP